MKFSEVKLGDVADEITVGHVGPMASEYVANGIPFLRSQNVLPFEISTSDVRYITPEFHERLKKSRLRTGDVVIVRTGKPGTCAVVPEWLPEANCSDLVIVRCGKRAHPRYIAYWVNSLAANHIAGHLVGAVQQHFNVGAARQMPLLLPELHDQLRILDVLGSLDDKIELNRRMNETLEAMAQAIFRDWFVDFGPTHRKLEGATDPVTIMGGVVTDPTRAQELADLFPATLGDDGLPEGWSETPIGSLTEIVGGSTPSTAESAFWDGGTLLWATPRDLSKLEGLHLFETERRITTQGLSKIGSGLSPEGTVLLSSRAPIGYLAITTGPTAVNQGFIAIRPSSEFPTAYALCWCKENMQLVKANANGSTFQEISKGNFRPLPVIDGGIELRNAFADLAQPLLDLCRIRCDENRSLASTRDLLLPKLMSGEIRLGEAEELVEAAQ